MGTASFGNQTSPIQSYNRLYAYVRGDSCQHRLTRFTDNTENDATEYVAPAMMIENGTEPNQAPINDETSLALMLVDCDESKAQ